MATITDSLHRFEARASDDEVKTDLELTCTDCGAVVCDIEHGDNLKVLAECADDHVCSVEEDEYEEHPYAEYATPEVLRDHLVEHHQVAPTIGRVLHSAGDDHLDNLHQMLHHIHEEKGICLRHGGPWGEDITCAMCTSATGTPYPYGHMYGLSGMQLERYDALMDAIGDHDAALADARQWPVVSEDEVRVVDEKFNWMTGERPPLISGTGELQQVYSDEELGLTDPRDVANAESNRILAERKAQEGS